jgi:hypothetical protein
MACFKLPFHRRFGLPFFRLSDSKQLYKTIPVENSWFRKLKAGVIARIKVT